jgi:hypothetical protein
MELLHQSIEGKDEDEVDDGSNEEEGNDGVHEVAVFDFAAVDVEDERGEVGLMNDGSNEWINDIGDEGIDDGGEGSADDDGNGKVHNIAAEDEVAKAFKHDESPEWEE